MPASSQGSLEVDQTLRLARDAIERNIAWYRIGVFASVVLLTAVLRLVGLSDMWVPTAFFAGMLAYAVLVMAFLRRYGNPLALAIVALMLDLGASVATFYFASHYASPEHKLMNVTFAMYITGPAMVLTLLINSLRNSTATARWSSSAWPVPRKRPRRRPSRAPGRCSTRSFPTTWSARRRVRRRSRWASGCTRGP
jgi:hypothetical protein